MCESCVTTLLFWLLLCSARKDLEKVEAQARHWTMLAERPKSMCLATHVCVYVCVHTCICAQRPLWSLLTHGGVIESSSQPVCGNGGITQRWLLWVGQHDVHCDRLEQ